ncbi:YjiH family protein [uncultured Clostridium sp.]|jgi:nucleoside recognition membrane protein YjiH|uniref:YjiH family protein n=1 Tax=uncultured Clostridium sp. TaxID=59620 RepID=UPI00263359F3|nr:YjiH family protein [uncultured Clostridium sp.]
MLNSLNTTEKKAYSASDICKFILPSLLGVLLFMVPIKTADGITIPVAFLSGFITTSLESYLPLILTIMITTIAILSTVTKFIKPSFIINNKTLYSLFNTSNIWYSVRIIGAIFALLTFFGVGPEFIISENTSGLLLTGLLPTLFGVFLFAGLFLPLLLNFGLLEFCGTMLTKIMKPLFGLPGRASVDCLTSWIGDGTIGVILTSRQYEEGHYTEKEACTIGTAFSAVSITFSFIIISQVGLQHMFVPFYITITFAGIIAAIILPKIGPLKNKSTKYYNDMEPQSSDLIPKGHTSFSYGLELAVTKASTSTGLKGFISEGIHNVLDIMVGVLPVVMAMGGIALILAEYTPIFKILGLPFIPLFWLLNIPHASEAASTILVGFADMFLPSVIIAQDGIAEITKFVVACVSVTQLIYMSEVGSVILGSSIPINIKELFIIFIQRTLITLPIIAIIAHILF